MDNISIQTSKGRLKEFGATGGHASVVYIDAKKPYVISIGGGLGPHGHMQNYNVQYVDLAEFEENYVDDRPKGQVYKFQEGDDCEIKNIKNIIKATYGFPHNPESNPDKTEQVRSLVKDNTLSLAKGSYSGHFEDPYPGFAKLFTVTVEHIL